MVCRPKPRLPRHRLRLRTTTTSCRTAGPPTGCSRSGARVDLGPPEPCSLTRPASRTAWGSTSLWQESSCWPSGMPPRWVKAHPSPGGATSLCKRCNLWSYRLNFVAVTGLHMGPHNEATDSLYLSQCQDIDKSLAAFAIMWARRCGLVDAKQGLNV